MKDFNKKAPEGNIYLWYQYSKVCGIDKFDLGRYKNMRIENTYYVYDEKGLLMGILNAPTDEGCLKEVKKYIRMKILLNLLYGGVDDNFTKKEKSVIRKTEWINLFNFIKSKLKNNDTIS
jgi:hypothetical protein